jgi:putative ABC transport system ATP-binding protein
MNLLELDQVTKTYGSGANAFVALQPLSLVLERGEVVLIMGPSGSGKTTLLSVMGCILRPTGGRVLVDGADAVKLNEGALPALRARMFGFIFQQYHLFDALTAQENVEMALRMKFGSYPHAARESARLLSLVGLGQKLRRKPRSLSGGERQRVAIARALAGHPPLLFGDEPTAALDTTNALAVVTMLRQLAQEDQRTVVLVSHDHRLEAFADRTLHMEDGTIKAVTSNRTLNSSPPMERSAPALA